MFQRECSRLKQKFIVMDSCVKVGDRSLKFVFYGTLMEFGGSDGY